MQTAKQHNVARNALIDRTLINILSVGAASAVSHAVIQCSSCGFVKVTEEERGHTNNT